MIPIAKPLIDFKEIQNIQKVLDSGMLAQGKFVEKFEREFAQYIGVKYAVATNSGTAALHTALMSLGIGKGDEVITTDFSFIASASCILMQNATPVFCDINPQTFNISPEQIERKITNRTKAILPVHLYGQACDMKKIMEIAENHNLLVVEDACQAHGAKFMEKKVGSIGNIGVFSFYPTKNMTTGEGGMITTNDKETAMMARMIRNHGQKQRYFHDFIGFNYRMTDIAAAIGLAQLEKLDDWNQKRIHNANIFTEELEEINGLIVPHISPGAFHVFHQYTIKIDKEFLLSRNNIAKYLKKKGIEVGIYYPLPLDKQPIFLTKNLINSTSNCPISSEISNKVLSLPIHPSINDDDLSHIAENIRLVGKRRIFASI